MQRQVGDRPKNTRLTGREREKRARKELKRHYVRDLLYSRASAGRASHRTLRELRKILREAAAKPSIATVRCMMDVVTDPCTGLVQIPRKEEGPTAYQP